MFESVSKRASPTSKTNSRISWLSRIVLVVSVILVLPGIQDREYHKHPITGKPGTTTYDIVFTHGWPLEYMKSPANGDRFTVSGVEWLWFKAWPLHGNGYNFRWRHLLVDVLCCWLMVVAANWLTNFWFRQTSKRKGRAWHSFTTLSLMIATAVIAYGISWYSSHATDKAIEVESDSEFNWAGIGGPYPLFEYNYRAPMWLRRLTGTDLMSVCSHRTTVRLYTNKFTNSLINELVEENSTAVEKLRRAEYISCHCDRQLLDDVLKNLKKLPRLQTLEIGLWHWPPISSHDLQILRNSDAPPTPSTLTYPRVTKRRHHGTGGDIDPLLGDTAIETLSAFPKLRNLTLLDSNLVADDLLRLSSLTSLKYLEFTGRDIFIEDIVSLVRFRNLKRVKLSISATDTELEEFQNRFPNLQLEWKTSDKISDLDMIEARFQRAANEPLEVDATVNGISICENNPSDSESEPGTLKSQHLVFLKDEILKQHLEQIECLSLGKVDTSETALELISHCKRLKQLEAPKISFPIQQLIALPNEIDWLHIQQGDLTVKDLQQLISKLPRGTLKIRESVMTAADAKSIQEISPDCNLMVFGKKLPGADPWDDGPVIHEW